MSQRIRKTSSSMRVTLCPGCEVGIVERTAVLEHLPCGYVDVVDAFAAASSADVRCPKCDELLSGDEDSVPRIASVYRCVDCDRRFDSLTSKRTTQTSRRSHPDDIATHDR